MSNYKQFKIERLDPISPTFCAAKWLMSDFYLHTGSTSSCHLPTPDKIDLDLVEQNINHFNNTIEKIEQRQSMMEGKQPDKCSNCWQVENNDPTAISERILYSHMFKDYDFTEFNSDTNQIPHQITVSFDTLCNFTCSYCDASQSSSWRTDLLLSGPYKNINNDNRKTYQRLGKNKSVDNYTYVSDKFFEYVVYCLPNLKKLNCLGGEPLISPNFWEFVDKLVLHDTSELILHVVTNLSNEKNLKKILKYKNKFKNIEIVASIDNTGTSAEFLRKGLNWLEFEKNLIDILEEGIDTNLIATLPGLALDNITAFLDWYVKLNQEYSHIGLKLYRLRHPNFQTIQVLPEKLKIKYKKEITQWLENNSNLIQSSLLEQIKNIIIVLDPTIDTYENIDVNLLQQDAKVFYKEFAKRHKFNLDLIFSRELCDWINN
jgi:MoaA/NifB/PqqE/SkfB family radical SAM enzyme